MSIKDSATIDVGYPIYAAKFINGKSLLVAGGGGEGNNGIPNKITVIRNSFKVQDKTKRLQRFREIELPGNEDSPMCLDVAKSGTDDSKHIIMIGCNQSTQLLRTMNINNNLRKYSFTGDEHLRFIDAAQLEEIYDVEDTGVYPKRLSLCRNENVGCFMTSEQPSFIYVFNPETLDLNFKYKPDKGEIVDFQLNPFDDGKTLCLITSSSIEVISAVTSNKISSSSEVKSVVNMTSKLKLSKVRFVDESTVIVTAHDKSGGISLIKYVLSEHKVAQYRFISKKAKAVTALDVSVDLNLIALAGNDTSVILVRLSDLKPLHTFKGLHKFAITDVSFSPRGDKVASVSAANSVHIMKIPSNYASSRSPLGTIMHYLLMSLLMALLAIVLQKGYENGQLKRAYHVSINYYQIGSRLVTDNGKLFYSFVKQKIQGENIDGDDATREYFTVKDWDASKIPLDLNSRTIDMSNKRRYDEDIHTSIYPSSKDTALVDTLKEVSTAPPSTTSTLSSDSKVSSNRPDKVTPSTGVTEDVEYHTPSQGSTGSIVNPSSNPENIEMATEENDKEDSSLVQSKEANMLEGIDNAPESGLVKEYPTVSGLHSTEIPETQNKIKDDESISNESLKEGDRYYNADGSSNGNDSNSPEQSTATSDSLNNNEEESASQAISHGTDFSDGEQQGKTYTNNHSEESKTPGDKSFSRTTSVAAGRPNSIEPSTSHSHDAPLEKESIISTNLSASDAEELLNGDDLPIEDQNEYDSDDQESESDRSLNDTQNYTKLHTTDRSRSSDGPVESEIPDHETGNADQDNKNSDEDYPEEEERNADVNEDFDGTYTFVHTPSSISTPDAEEQDLDESLTKKSSFTLSPEEGTVTLGSTKEREFPTTSVHQEKNSAYENKADYERLNYKDNDPKSHLHNAEDIEEEEEEEQMPRGTEDSSHYDAEDDFNGTFEPEENEKEKTTPSEEPALSTGYLVNDESISNGDESLSNENPYDIETETEEPEEKFSRTVKPSSSRASSEEWTILQDASNTPVSNRVASSIYTSGIMSSPKELTAKEARLKETIRRRAARRLSKTESPTSRSQETESVNDQSFSSPEYAGKITTSSKTKSNIKSTGTEKDREHISTTKSKPGISSHTATKGTAVSHSGVTPRPQSTISSKSNRPSKTSKVATKFSKSTEKTDQRKPGSDDSSLNTKPTPRIARTSLHARSGKGSPSSTISSSSTGSSRTPSRKNTRASRSSYKRSARTQRDEL